MIIDAIYADFKTDKLVVYELKTNTYSGSYLWYSNATQRSYANLSSIIHQLACI